MTTMATTATIRAEVEMDEQTLARVGKVEKEVKNLIHIMGYSPDKQDANSRRQCVHTLVSLTWGTSTNMAAKLAVVKSGGLEATLALLVSPDLMTQAQGMLLTNKLSRCEAIRVDLIKAGFVGMLSSIIRNSESSQDYEQGIKSNAIMTLANLVGGSEGELWKDVTSLVTDANAVGYVVNALNAAVQGHTYGGINWAAPALCMAARHLAASDDNKVEIGRKGGVAVLSLIAMGQARSSRCKGSESLEQSTSTLWLLAFDDSNAKTIRNTTGMIEELVRLKDTAPTKHPEDGTPAMTRRNAAGLLWLLHGHGPLRLVDAGLKDLSKSGSSPYNDDKRIQGGHVSQRVLRPMNIEEDGPTSHAPTPPQPGQGTDGQEDLDGAVKPQRADEKGSGRHRSVSAASSRRWSLESGRSKATGMLASNSSASSERNGGRKSPSLPQAPGGYDVMLSYNWLSQTTILRIRDALAAAGLKVWIDVEDMSGSVLDAMANAIEISSVILIGVSYNYKESPSCRTEGEYLYCLKKPFIPLLLEDGYVPDGWLGALIGSKLHFDFSEPKLVDFDSTMKRLVDEVWRIRGIVAPSPTQQKGLDQLQHTGKAAVGSVKGDADDDVVASTPSEKSPDVVRDGANGTSGVMNGNTFKGKPDKSARVASSVTGAGSPVTVYETSPAAAASNADDPVVARFLDNAGLGAFAPCFYREKINASNLSYLLHLYKDSPSAFMTECKEMGVTALGDRLNLVCALKTNWSSFTNSQ